MRMRRKTNLDSRIETCKHLLVAKPEEYYSRWLEEFSFDKIYVELGCGKGLFTALSAKNEPGILIIGLEKITNVLILALERTKQEGLQNLLFINKNADEAESFFADGEVSRIYINFCDPWPANRHAKRRLTGEQFLEIYKKILHPGGEIYLKTDNLPLFEFSLNEFEKCGFSLSEISYNLHEHKPVGIMTDYEKKFYNQNISINRCVATI